MPRKIEIDRWSGTVNAGATVRLPEIACQDFEKVRAFVKTDQTLKTWLAMGRTADSAAASPSGSASLPWATVEGTVASSTGAETGTPVEYTIYGGAQKAQIVLKNEGVSNATVVVDAEVTV